MSIDWSKAPEGATHWDTGLHGRAPGWMRQDGSTWYWWPVDGAKCERKWFVCIETYPSEIKEFVARPAAWTGEGRPPVGTVCEFYADEDTWRECKIVGENEGYLIVWVTHAHIWTTKAAALLRPIRTPEQIAAEERKTAIKEMQSDTECHVYADVFGRLYDAGYRKQVTP